MIGTGWDPESPSLLPAIVCYADILGFRALIERAYESGKEEEFLRQVKHSLAAAHEALRQAAKLGRDFPAVFDIKFFTDNIVVAYPLRDQRSNFGEPELGTLLMLFAQVQASLAWDGFFFGAPLLLEITTKMTILHTARLSWRRLNSTSQEDRPES